MPRTTVSSPQHPRQPICLSHRSSPIRDGFCWRHCRRSRRSLFRPSQGRGEHGTLRRGESVKPWAESVFGNNKWTFQWDEAPAHTLKKFHTHLEEVPGMVPREFPRLHPEGRMANSPDLNPLDYRVWSISESEDCATRHATVDAPKIALRRARDWIPRDKLRTAVESFPRRLRDVFRARGGHIEWFPPQSALDDVD